MRVSSRSDAGEVERQLEALGRELAVVGPQQHLALDRREAGDGLAVDDPHHRLRRDAVGGQRAHERAGARADVDVEVVDRAVDRQQVERPQRADLVHGAGEPAPAEHQRGLGAAPAAGLGVELDHVAHGIGSLFGRPATSPPRAGSRPMLRIAVLACALLVRRPGPLGPGRRACAQTKRILRTEMAKAGASSGAHVVDLESGTRALRRGRGGAAHPGLGREALHDAPRRCGGSGPEHDLDRRAGAGHRRPGHGDPVRQPLPARQRRPELRRARAAGARRRPGRRPASRRSRAAWSATRRPSTACAGRRRRASAPPATSGRSAR